MTTRHDLQPLELTVHTPPSPQEMSQAVHPAQRRQGRWKMLLVLAVCAAPVIASYFTYYVVRPEGRRNFGALIEPQRPMPEALMVRDREGQHQPLTHWKGQWLLVSTAAPDCDAACEERLYLQRQLRESLGREKDRVDWVWLVQSPAAKPRAELEPALQQAEVMAVERNELAQWLAPADGQQLEDHLYLVDPFGHWMLRFPAHLSKDQAPKAKRDLERVLRAAASWDQSGR